MIRVEIAKSQRQKQETTLGRSLIVALTLLLLTCPVLAQTTPTPTPSPAPQLQIWQAPSPTPTPEQARPLYGVQGVLVETLSGKVVASQLEDQQFNPASAVKLATSLVALRTLGPNHRFATGVWTDGVLEKSTGTITGNLYVSGRDPSFHYEHAVLLARELNQLGITKVTGDLVVAPGFTMNFSSSARGSGQQLHDTLDSTLRYAEAVNAWNYERTLLNDHNIQSVPSVDVMGAVIVGPVPEGARLLLTQRSSRLVDILKVLLCYSNNFMAERIGESLGGPAAVQDQLSKLLGVSPEQIKLSSLSGLGVNRISPRVMMKIYRALRTELQKNGLSPSDILPVAGIDPGTLHERFTGPNWRGSVIAKTGTLVRTDGGASALVGQLRAAMAVLLFVIMNQHGSIVRFRENQDYLVMLIQNSRGGPKAFDCKPITLMMQLSNTESSFGTSEMRTEKGQQ
jgi:D-alanyl-D-alanine carboxypeptidase/D-alanyl-D-alanine-endopeptidase (penicillin-binding protein 4)